MVIEKKNPPKGKPVKIPSPVTPYLYLSNAAAAIDFYKAAFGAVEIRRSLMPGSDKIMHARIEIDGALIMLSDDFSVEFNMPSRTPEALGGSPVELALQVEDAQATWDAAVAAGAIVTMPLALMFWGDLYGKIKDPFGQEWSISQTVKAMTEEEMEEAAKQFMSK